MKIFALVLAFFVMASSLGADAIQICDGDEEWPPFSYFERMDQGEKGAHLTGFVVDLIGQILSSKEIDFEIDKQMPWPRCQTEVLRGNRFQVVLQAGSSEERRRQYHLVGPIYTLQMSYFYARDRHPNGLAIEKAEDINQYRVCGLSGYDYSYEWLEPEKLDADSLTYQSLAEKLQRGRCDLFLESSEILRGFDRLQGTGTMDGISGQLIPGAVADEYYFLVTRQASNSEELVKILENGLRAVQRNGVLETLRKKYF